MIEQFEKRSGFPDFRMEQPQCTAIVPLERRIGETQHGIPITVCEYALDTYDVENWLKIQKLQQEITGITEEEAALQGLTLPDARNQAFRSLGPKHEYFYQGRAKARALNFLYHRGEVRFDGDKDEDYVDGGAAFPWADAFKNARAVRERSSVMETLVERNMKRSLQENPDRIVNFVSVASGSAVAAIKALKNLPPDSKLKATFIDIDALALEHSKDVANMEGVGHFVETIQMDITKRAFFKKMQEIKPDIIEIGGLGDYFDDKLATFVYSKMYESLQDGGALIVSNIIPNDEMDFLHDTILWNKMYYRWEHELADLFVKSGFPPKNTQMHVIPTGIYAIAEGRKEPKLNFKVQNSNLKAVTQNV